MAYPTGTKRLADKAPPHVVCNSGEEMVQHCGTTSVGYELFPALSEDKLRVRISRHLAVSCGQLDVETRTDPFQARSATNSKF